MRSNDRHTEFEQIAQARHHDPYNVLGKHTENGEDLVRAFLPGADQVSIAEGNLQLERVPATDLYEWRGSA